jgi:MFS family permease
VGFALMADAEPARQWLYPTIIFANAAGMGFVTMGFEILGSRFMNPYFGGSMTTWAVLISVVLLALMVGYFIGGHLADRYRAIGPYSVLAILAGGYLLAASLNHRRIIEGVMATAGDGPGGAFLAALALFFLPLALINMFSPFALRVLIRTLDYSGRVIGWVYGVSTVGNICGTLATAFLLIPSMGVFALSAAFSSAVIVLGASLLLLAQFERRKMP